VRGVVIDALCEMLNRGVTPMVRRRAAWVQVAIGALAHLALSLMARRVCG